ncbi:MAG: hypothetical protein K8R89_09025, partial [Anaerolineae bacterium]|nr:hypothetical protein [Anaerolineae bacterium]
YNRVAGEVDPAAYRGFLQEYLATKATLYSKLAAGSPPSVIKTVEAHLESAHTRLKINGYYGTDPAVESAYLAAGGESHVALPVAVGLEELTDQAYINDILENELRGVRMARHPQYATREGLTQYGMSWRDQSTYISQYTIDEGRTLTVRAILHEELQHRFWARGIEGSAVHHERMAPIIDRFMK